MIRFEQKGNFEKLDRYFKQTRNSINNIDFDKFGKAGVDALSKASPIDTGKTSQSWYYKIKKTKDSVTITFNNSDTQKGMPIVILLHYGHATKNGGWVEGRDFINPSIRPIFDELANNAWKEVTKK